MQISYHSVLTKIQKLQNFKKNNKIKKIFLYRPVRPVPAGIARNWPVRPVFFPVRNRGVECIGLLADTVYSGRTGRYGTKLITLFRTWTVLILLPHRRIKGLLDGKILPRYGRKMTPSDSITVSLSPFYFLFALLVCFALPFLRQSSFYALLCLTYFCLFIFSFVYIVFHKNKKKMKN